jgi:uncharacterized membrane protein
MTTKQFQGVRIAVAIMLATSVSIAVSRGSYIAPVIAVIAGLIIISLAKRQVKDVLADERDYKLAGTAARWSLSIFSIIMLIGFFILFALKDKNPELANMATLFAYLTCGLMLLNSLVFYFLRYKESGDKKNILKDFKHYLPFLILALVAAFIIAIASIRMFTPEDEWICTDGNWVSHGNPDAARPVGGCR